MALAALAEPLDIYMGEFNREMTASITIEDLRLRY